MIIDFEMNMPQFQKKRRIHMYLPDDYKTSGKKYPVLYMFDGHNLFKDEYATYGRSWNLATEVELSQKEMIIVGQECSHEGYSRLDEYGPYPFKDTQLVDIQFEGHGAQTMNFFVNTLKPYIDQNYPTLRSRKYTWIGGSSCGGLMAYFAGIQYSQTFSKALCISPYFSATYDRLYYDTQHLKIEKNTSFYISWGSKESGEHAFVRETKMCTELGNVLMKRGHHVEYNVIEGGRHCEEDWEKEAPRFLSFLFENGPFN